MGGYNPHHNNISHFLNNISKIMDTNMSKYENFMIIGDFNAEITDSSLSGFCDAYNLKNLITEPTCYKSINNPSSIDVILTNRKRSFHNSKTVETGLSDHHKMVVTTLKSEFVKKDPVIINYRSYKKFNSYNFRADLTEELNVNASNITKYEGFKKTLMDTLNYHAPIKKKVLRNNNAPFMNKVLTQAFMHRSKLKNRMNQHPTEENRNEYKKQRNKCVSLLRTEKKNYYSNLNIGIFDDNKTFWKKVKPLFTVKQKSLPKNITLINES